MTAKFMIEKIQTFSSKGGALYGRVLSGVLMPQMVYEGVRGTLRVDKIIRAPSAQDTDIFSPLKPLPRATEEDVQIVLALRGPTASDIFEGAELTFIEKELDKVEKPPGTWIIPLFIALMFVFLGLMMAHEFGVCYKHPVLETACKVNEVIRGIIR